MRVRRTSVWPARADLAWALGVGAAAFLVGVRFELFESFANWSRGHERLNVDEALVAVLAATLVLAVLTLRRARHTQRHAAAHVRTSHALAETNARFRSLFEYHPHGVFSLDLEGRFTSANAAAQRLSGYSLAELGGLAFLAVVRPEDHELTAARFLGILERRPQQFEVQTVHRDGHLVDLSVTGLPIVVDQEVVGVFGISEDVTERNRLQRELDDARDDADQANAAKSAFLANMSHELRTPLTSVLAAAELLSDTELDGLQARLADSLRRSGLRLLGLVDNILDFSRLEARATQVDSVPFDLGGVVSEAVALMGAPARQKGLELTSSVSPVLDGQVVGDPARITQILTNLVGNAVKFTGRGWVHVDTEVQVVQDDVVEVLFTVSDSGIGLQDVEVDDLFDAFIQAAPAISREYGGTGLGLAICKQLATLLGGSIWAAPHPGGGSTFSCLVPLRRAGESVCRQ